MRSEDATARAELARLRSAAGLSQEQLAAALGVSSGRVVRGWEGGRFAPRVEQLPGLARALGAPVEVVVAAIVGRDTADLMSAQATRLPDADPMQAIQFHLREVERLARQLADGNASTASPTARGQDEVRDEDATTGQAAREMAQPSREK